MDDTGSIPPDEMLDLAATTSRSRLYESVPVKSEPCGCRVIRLLCLDKPVPESTNDGTHEHVQPETLKGTLKTVLLEETPGSEALKFVSISYKWGPPASGEHELICRSLRHQSCRIPLTRNCYEMLIQFRRRFGTTPLWVDAICIDQENTDEKTEQIANMGMIYEKSDAVIIWLGESTPASEQAMTTLAAAWRLGKKVSVSPKGSWLERCAMSLMQHYIFSLLYQRPWDFSGQGFSGLQPLILRCVLATSRLRCRQISEDLEDILGRPWRTRAWTFQEFISARNPILMCGNQVLSWPNLIFALGYLQALQTRSDVPLPRSFEHWKSLSALWATVDWYRRNRGSKAPISIWKSGKEYSLAKQQASWTQLLLRHFWNVVNRTLGQPVANFFKGIFVPIFNSLFLNPIINIPIMLWFLGAPAVLLRLGITKGSSWPILAAVAKIMLELAYLFRKVPRLANCVAYGVDCRQHRVSITWQDAGTPATPATWIPREIFYPPATLLNQGIIEAMRERKATNPHDKVFAMYSILDLAGAEHQDANYDKPLLEVYRRFFEDLLNWDDDMIRLILDAGMDSAGDKPTWVPDWSDSGWRTWLDPAYFHFRNFHDATGDPSRHPKRGHRKRVTPDGSLRLRGMWIGTCQQVYKFNPTAEQCPEISLRMSEDPPNSLSSSLRTLVDWLCNASDVNMCAGEDRYPEVYEVLQARLLRSKKKMSTIPNGLKLCMSLIKSCIESNSNSRMYDVDDLCKSIQKNHEAMEFLEQTASDLEQSRSLFILEETVRVLEQSRSPSTLEKKLLGTGPLQMQAGDKVALVKRVPVPLVFRRVPGSNEESFDFVGPAFVAGAMTGEKWRPDGPFQNIRVRSGPQNDSSHVEGANDQLLVM